MKIKTFTFVWMAVAVAAVLGATSRPVRADINPALSYYQGFLLAPDLSEGDFDYLATNNSWSATLPARFGKLVERYDAEFKLVRHAASSTVACDWGVDLRDGADTLLPHLARCKAVMIGARYRVSWHLQNNRQAEARDDFLAAFALARNISHDGTLISVMVQIAAEAIGCNIVAENFGKFSPKTLQEVIEGMDAAPSRGTAAASIRFEKMTLHDWLVQKVLELKRNNPGDETKVMAAIRELLTGVDGTDHEGPNPAQPSLWEQLSRAGGDTSDGILKLLHDEGEVYDKLATVMALPYAEFDTQATTFAAELKQSNNPLIAQILPACLKARQREFKVQVWLAMLHAALEYRLHGDPGLLTVADPCGQGPFAYQRVVFDGVDRGFQLRSAFQGSGFTETIIFLEKSGPPLLLDGPHVGEARVLPKNQN